jgi:VIT1/CCC1 family predicted Fe2+/Mn2+ transporter
MAFHHQMPTPAASRPLVSALTIASGYMLGGLVPLIPYFIAHDVLVALWWSIGVMAVALFAFGWVKTGVVQGWCGLRNMRAAAWEGCQMVAVGGAAAGAAVGIVKAFEQGGR